MGVDIYCYAEYRRYGDSPWFLIMDNVFTNPYFRKDDPLGQWNLPFIKEPYVERNYKVYHLLDTVLAKPRGLPKDVSPCIHSLTESHYGSGYNHSYFSLCELKRHDWSKEKEIHGGQFTKLTLPELDKFIKMHGNSTAEDIRIVFWFDS